MGAKTIPKYRNVNPFKTSWSGVSQKQNLDKETGKLRKGRKKKQSKGIIKLRPRKKGIDLM